MKDMRDLYKAYSAVHDTTISEELTKGRDQISEMNLGQMLESDLVEVCEEIVEGLFQYGLGLEEACDVVSTVLENCVDGVSSELRNSKITQIAEAFETVVDTVTTKAERNCEEEFLKYRQNKPLTEKWNNRVSHEIGNQKLHAALIHEDRENIKLGLIEMISDLIEAREPGETPQAYADRMKKKYSGGKSKTYDPMKDKNFDHDKAERTRGSMKEEEEVSTLRQGWGNAYAAIYEKKLDPVGKEDGDIDNDGDKDSSDKYLAKRRNAISKSMKKEEVEQVDEDSRRVSNKQHSARVRSNIKSFGSNYTPPKNYDADANRGKGEVLTDKQVEKKRRKALRQEESDIQYPTGEKKKFTKDKTDPKVAAGRKAAKEMGLKHNEGFIPIDKTKQDKINRQIGRAADKEAIEKGKSKKYGRDEKKIETQYQRQQAMRFGKKMKKEGVEFSEAELKAFEEIINSWED